MYTYPAFKRMQYQWNDFWFSPLFGCWASIRYTCWLAIMMRALLQIIIMSAYSVRLGDSPLRDINYESRFSYSFLKLLK